MNSNVRTIRSLISNSDIVGATASILCIAHCILTPFLFAAQATVLSSCWDLSPTWWRMIDFLFLVITFFAISYSAKSTLLKWTPTILYLLWALLAVLTINKFFQIVPLPHFLIYSSAIGLSVLHLYNLYHSHYAKNVV